MLLLVQKVLNKSTELESNEFPNLYNHFLILLVGKYKQRKIMHKIPNSSTYWPHKKLNANYSPGQVENIKRNKLLNGKDKI